MAEPPQVDEAVLRAVLVWVLRKIGLWFALGLLLIGLGGVWSLKQQSNLVAANKRNIMRLAKVNQALVQEQYHADTISWQACQDRNALFRQQLRQDEAQLRRLVRAHTKDGSINAAKVWTDYLEQGRRTKLPGCGPKPEPPSTEEVVRP